MGNSDVNRNNPGFPPYPLTEMCSCWLGSAWIDWHVEWQTVWQHGVCCEHPRPSSSEPCTAAHGSRSPHTHSTRHYGSESTEMLNSWVITSPSLSKVVIAVARKTDILTQIFSAQPVSVQCLLLTCFLSPSASHILSLSLFLFLPLSHPRYLSHSLNDSQNLSGILSTVVNNIKQYCCIKETFSLVELQQNRDLVSGMKGSGQTAFHPSVSPAVQFKQST